MTYVFLPHENNIWLHKLDGIKPSPVAKLPGGELARYFISTDHLLFALWNPKQRHVCLYQLLNSKPWIEEIISPIALPEMSLVAYPINCFCPSFFIHDSIIYVGGHGENGEFIWKRGLNDKNWLAIELPDNFLLKHYNSSNLLFLENDKLIGVNNNYFYKWAFTYDINVHGKHFESLSELVYSGKESYESIYAVAYNDHYIAIIYRRGCYGFKGVSLLDKKTLRKVCYWIVDKSANHRSIFPSDLVDPDQIEDIIGMINEMGIRIVDGMGIRTLYDYERILKVGVDTKYYIESTFVYGVVFLANYLLLATEDGLMCVDTAMENDGKASKKSDNVKWVFKVMPLKTLLCPFYFVTIPESSSALFVVGKLTDQQLGYELITCQDLKQLCKNIIPEIASNLNGSI